MKLSVAFPDTKESSLEIWFRSAEEKKHAVRYEGGNNGQFSYLHIFKT